MKIKHPCGPRITLKLKKIEKVSQGGIIIETESTGRRAQYGTELAYVEQIGNGCFPDESDQCKVGDLVMITKYCGSDYTDKETDEIYRVVEDTDIIAVLEEEK